LRLPGYLTVFQRAITGNHNRVSGYPVIQLRLFPVSWFSRLTVMAGYRLLAVINRTTCTPLMPGTPQQNGVAERHNRTLMDMVRSMLSNSSLPISL
jgi:hypothetical protein